MADTDLFSVVALTLAAIAGLPHGAMDFYVAKRLKVWRTTRQMMVWLTQYILISMAVVLFWWATPVTALSLFLLLSALHFGRDFYPQNAITSTLVGSLILSLPAFFHLSSVTGYFEALFLAPAQASFVALTMYWVTLIALVIMAGYSFIFPENRLSARHLVTISILAAIAYFTNPLVYFALYFALSHSPKHLFRQWQQLSYRSKRGAFRVLLMLTLLPVITGGIFVWASGIPTQTQIIAVVFIGLAALTFPHMLLIEHDIKNNRDIYG